MFHFCQQAPAPAQCRLVSLRANCVAGDECEAVAARRERLGDGRADPTGGTGDENEGHGD